MNEILIGNKKLIFKKKILKLIGGALFIKDENDENLFYVEQRGFKLKEDIRVYTDESKTEELISIKARNIIDAFSIIDVFDSQTNTLIGSIRRKALKSLVRDTWEILDINENVVGLVEEDNAILAIVRRFITNLVPQSYWIIINQEKVAFIKGIFGLISFTKILDFSYDSKSILDKRLAIAITSVLMLIEGRQN